MASTCISPLPHVASSYGADPRRWLSAHHGESNIKYSHGLLINNQIVALMMSNNGHHIFQRARDAQFSYHQCRPNTNNFLKVSHIWYGTVLPKQMNQQMMLNVMHTVIPLCCILMHIEQFIISLMISQNLSRLQFLFIVGHHLLHHLLRHKNLCILHCLPIQMKLPQPFHTGTTDLAHLAFINLIIGSFGQVFSTVTRWDAKIFIIQFAFLH